MSKTVGDFFWERLSAWGIRRIFGFPGDGINGLVGALERAQDRFDFVQVRHEEMAAFMACAHAKFTGELGVCMATSARARCISSTVSTTPSSTTSRCSRSSASRRAARSAATTSRRSTCRCSSKTSVASSQR